MSIKKKKRPKYGPNPPPPPIGHPPYNVNGEGGRPKKWDEKSLDELAESLDKWMDIAIESKKEFWWQDWAFEVGANPDKLLRYAEESPRFRRSYERAKAWQAHIVQRYALTKKFSEGFSKFFLINRYPDHWKGASITKEDAKDILKEASELVKDTQSPS